MQQRAVIVSLAALQAQAAHRPAGYVEDVISQGKRVGETVELTPAKHAALVTKYQTAQPLHKWPDWALQIQHQREDADRGVGDTVARLHGGAGTEDFKAWHEEVFGLWAAPCGCAGQIATWNAQFRYGEGESD